MKVVVLFKAFSSSFGCAILPVTPGLRQTIHVLDTVACSVFYMYLFTVAASINFYAHFSSFLVRVPFIKM